MKKIAVAVMLAFGLAMSSAVAFADDALVAGGSPANASPSASDAAAGVAAPGSEAAVPAPTPDPEPGWKLADDGSTWNYFTDVNDASTLVKGEWVATADGPAISGLPSGKHRYWLDADGALAKKRLINPDKNDADENSDIFAYVNKYGFAVTGKHIVGNRVYLAKKNGELESGDAHGILATKAYDGKKRVYYINPKTHSAVVTKAPVMVKGFGWVFAHSKRGFLVTGREVIGGKVYLARDNGKLETGNAQGFLSTKRYDAAKQSRLYFIDKKTHAITYGKPVQVSEKWGYVFAPNKQGYVLQASTRYDSNHVLLVEKNGRICNTKGWVVTTTYAGSLQRYRLEPTSKNPKVLGARTGLFDVSGKRYLANGDGTVVHSTWKQYDGKIYHVNDAGAMTYDEVTSRMYRLAQGYSSPSRYLLMVDIDNPRTMVFEGSRGNWKVAHIWDCCTGTPSTPTITGTFSVGSKGHSFGEGNGYSCYYWTQISGDYLFHTRLYYANTHTLMDATMGARASHGCVRLMDDAALWIQRNAPAGTTVACIR